MPVSPGFPDMRDGGAEKVRLASAGQRHSPFLSSAVNGVDPSYYADVAHPVSQQQNLQNSKTLSHDGHSQKCGDQRCDEDEEETEDDYDDFAAFSLDEARYAVYGAARGRSLPQQARDVLVPPCSHSPPSTTTSKACDNATAARTGIGPSGRREEIRAEQQDTAGSSSVWTEGEGGQGSSNTPRPSSSPAFASSSGTSVGDSSTGNAASSDLPPSAGKREANRDSVLRRLLWMRLLGVLQDADPFSWMQQLQQHRQAYVRLQEEEERQLSAKRLTMLDPQRFHPLAATADNPWSQRQQNEALLMEIWKDVERTLAERRLFRTESTRKSLQRILFTWSRRNPEVSYKQGMNELLAIFYLVCYREKVHVSSPHSGKSVINIISSDTSNRRTNIDFTSTCNSEGVDREVSPARTNAAPSDLGGKRDGNNAVEGGSRASSDDPPPSETSIETAVQTLLSPDPAAVEADAFALFEAVMNRFMLKAAYLPAPSAPTTAGGGVSLLHKGSSGGGRYVGSSTTGLAGGLPPLIARSSIATASKSALLWRCNYLFETLLPFADRQLYEHLKNEEVEPQLFLLRWIRLLFSREFHIEDTLLLWDALFADAYLHEAIERGGYQTSSQPAASLQESACSVPPSWEVRGSMSQTANLNARVRMQEGQEQQQQQHSSIKKSKNFCTVVDPFKSLLRHTTAPDTSSAVEVTYDPAQVCTAAAAKLPLVDFFVLAMLKYVRATLLDSNQILCLRRLLRFPPTESIQPLVLLAVSLRTRRFPQPGRSMHPAAAIQQSLSSPSGSHKCPVFPSIRCIQVQQSQQQLQVKQHDQHQVVHQEQQQQPRKREHEHQQEILGSARGGGAEISQEAAVVEQRNIQQAYSHNGTTPNTSSPLSPAAATMTNNCSGDISQDKVTSTKAFSPYCQEDRLMATPSCVVATPVLRLTSADATPAGVDPERPAAVASAPADATGNTTKMSCNGNPEIKGSCCNSGTVHIDVRSAGAAGDRCASTAELAGLNASTNNSSRSLGPHPQRETDASVVEYGSSIIPGKTISRHVEEVTADLHAALALWSSRELLSQRTSTSR